MLVKLIRPLPGTCCRMTGCFRTLEDPNKLDLDTLNLCPTSSAKVGMGRFFTASSMLLASQNSRFMVVGLGNSDLPHTRHSVGMTVVDKIASWLDLTWKKERALKALVAQTVIDNQLSLILIKSKHPMNLNGKSIAKAAGQHGVAPENIYLIHDDLDRPLGKFGVKLGGSARGHNGVRSAISCLHTEDIPRLRIGIDRPADKSLVVDYVLERFSVDEMAVVKRTIPLAVNALLQHWQRDRGVDPLIIQQIKMEIPS